LVIDEVQLEPSLFRAIKAEVDRDRRPGRFLITGSSRLLSAPGMADALVGRVEMVELWPFRKMSFWENARSSSALPLTRRASSCSQAPSAGKNWLNGFVPADFPTP
jgi:predicted AAA+ superfamily ATPase